MQRQCHLLGGSVARRDDGRGRRVVNGRDVDGGGVVAGQRAAGAGVAQVAGGQRQRVGIMRALMLDPPV